MKNRIYLKRLLILISCLALLNIIIFVIFNRYTYSKYQKNYNNKVNSIVNTLKENYPNITEEEIVKVINSSENDSNVLEDYGYSKDDSLIEENDNVFIENIIFVGSLFILEVIAIIILIYVYDYIKSKKIKDIIKLMEQINNKDYSFNMDDVTEDEFSLLKNEIYKVTIMLKEGAIVSSNEKRELKNSLEDISHQIKTPLTSILIMLDNIIDNPDMDDKLKEEFINDIKREASNINLLVQSLLKLSKFDANTVSYINKENNLNDILSKAITNVSTLCDLKNIKINVHDADINFVCDFMWQTEALTNIIKNSVEHSNNGSCIDIFCKQNKIYTEVIIKDYGEGISKKDLPHIFKRFYKCSNSTNESYGIGLSLAKTIIDKNNGSIKVKSEGVGTEFIIKYFK